MITEESVIGDIIEEKGMKAGEIIDAALCDDGEKACCPGTTLKIGYAANLKGKSHLLPEILEKLNAL